MTATAKRPRAELDAACLAGPLAGFRVEDGGFDLGEVSFHAGWTFHRAGSNRSAAAREVMTITYMDKDMRLATPKNTNQVADRERWCPGVEIGEVIASPLNPVLYSSRSPAGPAA